MQVSNSLSHSISLLTLGRIYWNREVPKLPSQVGLERTLVETRTDLYEYYLNRVIETKDCFFPFYTPLVTKEWSVDMKDKVLVNRIFIDIDKRIDPKTGKQDTFEDIWKRGHLFFQRFWPNMELFFSGGKGFHIYLYITPTTMGELRQYRERLFAVFSTWLQYLLDKKAFLSLDRICRTSFTKHSIDVDHPTALPLWKVPIVPNMELPEILRCATYPDHYLQHLGSLSQRVPEQIDWRLFLQSPDTIL